MADPRPKPNGVESNLNSVEFFPFRQPVAKNKERNNEVCLGINPQCAVSPVMLFLCGVAVPAGKIYSSQSGAVSRQNVGLRPFLVLMMFPFPFVPDDIVLVERT